jgi:hypothetical protein
MKKKLLCSALVLAMLSLNATGAFASEPLKGDVDADGILTANDCAVLLRKVLNGSYAMPIEEKTDSYFKYADVTDDGILAADDAAAILGAVLRGGWSETGAEVSTEGTTEATTESITEATTEGTTEATTEGTTEAVTYKSEIVLKDGGSTVNGLLESNGGVVLDNTSNIITVTNGGNYNISGELTNGQIIVDSEKKVELNLNGVSITNASGPAIYGLNGDIEISAKKDSVNTLSDGEPTELDEDNEPDACIFSHDDILLKGTGELTINGNYANGVSTKDGLTVQKLTLKVTSTGNALKGKDSVTVKSGTLTLVSSTADGIRCTKGTNGGIVVDDGTINITAADNGLFAKAGDVTVNGGTLIINTDTTSADTDTYNYDGIHSKAGNVSLNGGSINITAYCDGVQAATKLTVGAAKVGITTTGTTSTTSSTTGRPMWQESSTDSGISAKGLKSDGTLEIADGADITVTSTDDAIHCNDTAVIDGGTMVLSTGDDGVHADNMLTVNGGSINITKSYEGLEAENIYINGGNISVKSSDDSINAAGGNDSSGNFGMSSSTGYMEFNGGYIYCENTDDGDGIDSNGVIVINGGTLLINGTSQSDNAAIDYGDNDYLSYNGGTVVAIGSSNMAVKPDSSRSTGITLYCGGSSNNKGGFGSSFGGGFGGGFGNSSSSGSISISAGTLLTLTDESGEVVLAFKTKNASSFVMISSDDLKTGSTYTLYKDGTYSGTLDDNNYATGGTVTGATKVASATVSSTVNAMS